MKKYPYDSHMKDFYDAPEGVYVLNSEAQAEIAELKDFIFQYGIENIKLQSSRDIAQEKIDDLINIVAEADEYLDTNKHTNIGNGSILHKKFKEALAKHRSK